MKLTRRGFAAGALSAGVALQLPSRSLAQPAASLEPALSAIRAYGQAHLRQFTLPGMTLGLTAANGFTTVMDFGFANRDSRTPITGDTLFQIGSISKSMTAALVHQLAAEGRLRLSDRISALLPQIPLPSGNAITVQHLLDHTGGLPDDAPMFPPDGLWTGHAPGAHWHYSNTGYRILGKLAEHAGGKALSQLLRDRIFAPLGMSRTKGAIIAADRMLYAQGYEPADLTAPVARGVPLAPAAWVDVMGGAGNVAATAADMMLWLRTLANAAQGRGGPGLNPQQARAFTSHLVPSDTPGMTYGNGLMHVGGDGRSYLHHTGGMVGFSSSFHVDVASGVGAFASSTISAFAEYRPRLLTRFAVDALTESLAGRPVPPAPGLEVPLGNPAAYTGLYSGPAGGFEVRPGTPLTLAANGQEAALQPWGDEQFRTTHPDFRGFTLLFERKGPAIAAASWGPNTYLKTGAGGTFPAHDPALARLAGRYVNDSPWWGTFLVVERGGKLWIGTETPLVRVSANLWRVGKESWTPERASFADFIDGRPQTLVFSGEKFLRHDI